VCQPEINEYDDDDGKVCHLSHLSVCLSVQWANCGKTADWIWMPFGVMSGVSQWMSVLDGGGDCQRERGSFENKCVASHCNQWGLCGAVM